MTYSWQTWHGLYKHGIDIWFWQIHTYSLQSWIDSQSCFAFEGVLEFDGLDNLYWSKDTHISPPLFLYFSWTSSISKSSEIHKQISFNKNDLKNKIWSPNLNIFLWKRDADGFSWFWLGKMTLKSKKTYLAYSRKFRESLTEKNWPRIYYWTYYIYHTGPETESKWVHHNSWLKSLPKLHSFA